MNQQLPRNRWRQKFCISLPTKKWRGRHKTPAQDQWCVCSCIVLSQSWGSAPTSPAASEDGGYRHLTKSRRKLFRVSLSCCLFQDDFSIRVSPLPSFQKLHSTAIAISTELGEITAGTPTAVQRGSPRRGERARGEPYQGLPTHNTDRAPHTCSGLNGATEHSSRYTASSLQLFMLFRSARQCNTGNWFTKTSDLWSPTAQPPIPPLAATFPGAAGAEGNAPTPLPEIAHQQQQFPSPAPLTSGPA